MRYDSRTTSDENAAGAIQTLINAEDADYLPKIGFLLDKDSFLKDNIRRYLGLRV